MPKPVKKGEARKRPASDPILRAKQLMDEQMAKFETSEKPWERPAVPTVASFQEQYKAHMAKLGAKGGKVSGAKRMEMPAEERRAIALKAARARWAAVRKQKAKTR